MKVEKTIIRPEPEPGPQRLTLKSLQLEDNPLPASLKTGDSLKISVGRNSKILNLILPEVLFDQEPALPKPDDLFKKEAVKPASPENKVSKAAPEKTEGQLAAGVWFSDKLRTADGGVVRVLTVQPEKADLSLEFSEKGKAVLPGSFKQNKNFIAAINGQFFGPAGTIGDMKAGNKIFLDETVSSNYDKASDKRYFVSITKDGKLKTGKGGITENGKTDDYKMFLGGMCLLYTKDQLANLDKDIKSGEFSKRVDFSGASQASTISRSFIGVTKDGKLLLVAAGEGALRSKGVNFVEAAKLLKKLGAVEAYILDGGGSTSMHVKGQKSANTDGRAVKSYISVNSK